MTNNSRIEGTLATLRQEWSDTEARLKAIEDAIRAVQRLLDEQPSLLFDSNLLITPHGGLADLSLATGSLILPGIPGSAAAGRSVASGGHRAVFPDTPGTAAAGKSVASVADDPLPPPRRLARRPPLKVSILTMLKERPTMWPLDLLVKAMREQRLVGGASEKTIKETIRQTANKMAAEGEIRREGSEYGWPGARASDRLAQIRQLRSALEEALPVGPQQGS